MNFFVGLCIGLAVGIAGTWYAYHKWAGKSMDIRLPK